MVELITGATDRVRAQALADPTRFEIHRFLGVADRPRSITEITEAVGVHHTAVRAHLAKLRDAGLVVETSAEPSGRGRPKLLYATARGSAAGRDPYRELSAMLVRAVRERRSPRDVGAEAGRAIVDQGVGGDLVAGDAVDLIQREATELGFDPVRRGRADRPDLVLRHCPFADVAAEDPDSICSLHLGVAEGIAGRLGGVEVLGMVVRDPQRAGCRLQLRRTPSEQSQDDQHGVVTASSRQGDRR